MQNTQVQSLVWEDSLEKEMVTHSRTLAWEIPGTRGLAGYSPRNCKRVGHDLVTKQQKHSRVQTIYYIPASLDSITNFKIPLSWNDKDALQAFCLCSSEIAAVVVILSHAGVKSKCHSQWIVPT